MTPPPPVVTGLFGHYRLGVHLASGGTADLYRTSHSDVVYKHYRDPLTVTKDITNLEGLVRIGREVLMAGGAEAGATPESSVCWPIDHVPVGSDGSGGVLGALLPTIPPTFFKPDGDSRTLDFLLLARANPPAAKARTGVLIRVAEILAWLDRRELVHGDISAKNLVWSADGGARAYLIDADALRPRNPPPIEGVSTAGWTDPRLITGLIPAHDHFSDRYALALAIYRGLFLNPGNLDRRPDGSWPRPSALPAGLDADVLRCIETTLGDPLATTARTSPDEWVKVLLTAFVDGSAYRESALAVLDDDARARQANHTAARNAVATSTPHFTPLPGVGQYPPTGQPTAGTFGPGLPPAAAPGTSPRMMPSGPPAQQIPFTPPAPNPVVVNSYAPPSGHSPGYGTRSDPPSTVMVILGFLIWPIGLLAAGHAIYRSGGHPRPVTWFLLAYSGFFLLLTMGLLGG